MVGNKRTVVPAVISGEHTVFDDIFDKQPMRRKPVETIPKAEFGVPEDFGSFGWLPTASHRAVMLEVRHQDGLITAFSYSWLESALFNPSEGITLNFSGKAVKLIGRNLNAEHRPNIRLFEGIVRYQVLWVQEAGESMMKESDESDSIIEKVMIE
jgi:hypothetical protein